MRAERSEAGQVSGRGYPSPRAGGSAQRSGGDPRNAGGPPPRDRGPRAPQGRPSVPVDSRRTGHPGEQRRPSGPPPAAARDGQRTGSSANVRRVEAPSGPRVHGALAVLGVFLVTRRRDLLTVVVAPPLVYVAVAVVNVALAPAATLSLTSLATLLVRGFPAMGVATGAAVVIGLFRLVSRR